MKTLFAIIYRKWLWNGCYQSHDKVIRVTGWRTAIVEDKADHRHKISPCFKIFGLNFD